MAVIIDGTNGITAPNVFGKNVIINGNFAINQRGVSGTVTLSAGVYGHDRFKAGAGGCTYTFATSQNVTTLTITAGTLIQVIEGANLLTDTYTLTFTGTAQGKIGAGSFGASGITGSVTGGTNLNVEFNTGTVSLVQLERGSVATPFEFRSIGQELALCQRYFEKSYNLSIAPGSSTSSSGWAGTVNPAATTFVIGMAFFKTAKRASPTISIFADNGTASNITLPDVSAAVAIAGVERIFEAGFAQIILPSGNTGGRLAVCNWTANSEL